MARRTIVLGVDGSAGSDAAVRWCADNAGDLGARVVAVHALPPLMFLVPPTGTGKAVYPDEEEIRAGLAGELDQWCAPARDAGVPCETRLVDGVAAETLMRIAGEVGADLIVVGRRGRGGFAELLLGSVPHTLSHHATVPLVIVPAPARG